MRQRPLIAVAFWCWGAAATAGVDAPQLAPPGRYAVGVASQTLVQPDQVDVLATDPGTGAHPRVDRILPIDIWYPAGPPRHAQPVVYVGALTGEDGKDVTFTGPGVAFRGAPVRAGSFPLVILAHGYGGTPVAMSWLAENLASKGYVVVGPHFNDPPITDTAKFVQPLTRRPLDIAFVANEARNRALAHAGAFAGADPARTVLIGYSMGGYGALTAAGSIRDLKAIVAIAPAGRFGGADAFAAHPLSGLVAPTLFIVGNRDAVVGYDPGVKTIFEREIHAPRYLLTLQGAGHSIGMNPAPASMRGRLWDLDWWEDPVWRKDRELAIELHFITAFLDRYVKGDLGKAAFLDVPQVASDQGVWVKNPGEAWGAYSPGAPPITVWKGFQNGHAEGLELRFAPAAK